MTLKSDGRLARWIVEALEAHDGSASIVEICKHIWRTHESDLRKSGDGFYTWRVAPTFVLKYNIRTRSSADPGAIEDVLAVENDVVPFDRADVLEQGCGKAFLGDSLRLAPSV